MFIHQLAIKRLPLMALVVLGALVYLVASVVSLFVSVATAKANTAPEGSYHLISIDGADAVNNWDYDSTENVGDDTVDWGMRFLFAGDVINVNYVKNRLDGDGDDPTITPELDGVGFAKFAWLDDGQEQTDSNWDMDLGHQELSGVHVEFGTHAGICPDRRGPQLRPDVGELCNSLYSRRPGEIRDNLDALPYTV